MACRIYREQLAGVLYYDRSLSAPARVAVAKRVHRADRRALFLEERPAGAGRACSGRCTHGQPETGLSLGGPAFTLNEAITANRLHGQIGLETKRCLELNARFAIQKRSNPA